MRITTKQRLIAIAALAIMPRTFAADVPLTELPYSPSLNVQSIDKTAAPCDDFYRFACGAWQVDNPIPGDQSSWGVYEKLQEDNLRFLWGLALAAAEPRAGRSVPEQKVGDYFGACMDDTQVQKLDMTALAPTMQKISQLKDRSEIATLLGQMHQQGVDALFRFGAEQDFTDSSAMIAGADAGGLGLPERDYYVRQDAKSKAIRKAYLEHVARVLVLSGLSTGDAVRAAAQVLTLETLLAKASLSVEARRDPHKVHHKMTAAQLARLAPSFPWGAYFEALGVATPAAINVAEPDFIRKLGGLWKQQSLATWKVYLQWHLLTARASYMAEPFATAHFDFSGTTLQGVTSMPPRWKQCVAWVDRDLGEALGQLFVERTFAPETRARTLAMTEAIEAAMKQRIAGLDWMSPATKEAANEKLKTLVKKIGYPQTWRDYSALNIERNDFLGNVERSQRFEAIRQLAKIGQPVDRTEWYMTPPTVNAYYSAQTNDINFPAGILQPPLFDPRMDDAPNFGNTGATIGHELTHAFDDEGSKFDAQGNLRQWWKPKDEREFKRRTACVVDQYSGYTAVDDVKVNGKLTLGEDVADLGGTILAYVAWKATTAGQVLPAIDGFTPDQRFFIGMAQWACSNIRPEAARLQAQTDPHSPPRYRVNGVVSNMPEFAAAFSCKPGQAMVKPKVCKVW